MKKIALMSWSDSNMAGDSWTWFIALTFRKDGTYSVSATQTSIGAPTYRLPGIYPLRKGRQVKEAIEKLFLDDSLSTEEIDWDGINAVLLQHSPKLAAEIKETFKEDVLLEKVQEKKAAKKKRDQKPIDDWVAKAIWPRSNFSHHIANGMDNYKRKKAVFEFVQGYYSEHNRLPTGLHLLGENFSVQFPEQ